MKIFFSGGGTLGPVTPLLAIHDVLSEYYPDATYEWFGTVNGVEKELIAKYHIPYTALSSGKLRRYWSLWNIIDIGRIIIGFFQAIVIMWRKNPDICISAGGYVSVPLHIAAWLFGVPTWIHQQDVRVGLANRLMAPTATLITTALEQSTKRFPRKKTVWLGNPVRPDILRGKREVAVHRFRLEKDMPVVFATGGGTGSLRVNQLIVEMVEHVQGMAQIIHVSGKERPQDTIEKALKHYGDSYHSYQFFTEEMKDAYAIADMVISRGGFGTLSELAALNKPSILIPKPGHQEENVRFLAEAGAVIIVDERTATGLFLAKTVRELLVDTKRRQAMGQKLGTLLPAAKPDAIRMIVDRLRLKKRFSYRELLSLR